MAIGCSGLLWVTRGGVVECQKPDLGLAPGFLWTLRNEYLGRSYVSLDLDPKAPVWSDDDISAITEVVKVGFQSSVASGSDAPGEFEIIKDTPRNLIVSPDGTADLEKSSLAPLHQTDRPLSMYVGMPGLLDTLVFDDHPLVSAAASEESIPADLVEIEPRTYGVNFRDVMVAMGSEAAKQGYLTGDRVFCLLRGPFGSRTRIKWMNVSHMLNGLSFEEAASLPVIFCTAYIGLIDLACLGPGNTILIYAAAVVGVAGNASQSNYSTAGSFQDALARWRVSRDLPAVAIDLGAVKAIGVAAETAGVLGRLQRTGHIPLSEDQVLSILASAILTPYQPQVVVGLNSGPGNHWDRTGESQLGRDARFLALRAREIDQIQGKSGGASGDSLSLASKLASASSSDEAIAAVGTAIAEKLSDDIELANRPAQYGIDSLVAVELRNMLVQQAAAEISIFGIMQSALFA
ncbi:hypothetical protein H9Q73_007445 [Fusarium xylarioides]|nr:hypothetical protein H9Q73_007445 [Fusarium xylarioides]